MSSALPAALLVEDDPLQASVTAAALASAGFEVVIADTGAAALDRFRERAYHLAVVDLMIPDIHGSRLIEVLRQSPGGPSTKIIAVTASSESCDLESAFKSGADDVYQKSVGHNVLVAKFSSLALKFHADVRTTLRLDDLEKRLRDHVADLGKCSAEKDEQIAEMRTLVKQVVENTSGVKELVVAWKQTTGVVRGVKAFSGLIRSTWLVWAPILAVIIWLKTGHWTLPK